MVDIGQDKIVREIVSRLKASSVGEGVIKIAGTWGSYAPMLAAYLSKEVNRPILYVCPHIDDADKVSDDLRTFGAGDIEVLPAWEGDEDLADATDEIRSERLRVTMKALGARANFIIAASAQALCQPIPKPQAVEKSGLSLRVNQGISPDEIAGWLVDNGFEHVEGIDVPGQFARRGGIVDIYAPLVGDVSVAKKDDGNIFSQGAAAIRVEFFGDTIESIREIDLDTQRSNQHIENISIISAVCGTKTQERELFVNILPQETVVIFEEPGDIEEVANVYLERAEEPERLYRWSDIYSAAKRFTQAHICKFAASPEEFLKVDVGSIAQFQQSGVSMWAGHKEALEQLTAKAKEGKTVYLYCERTAEIERVREIIGQLAGKIPDNFKLLTGFINQGFAVNSLERDCDKSS